MDLLPDRLRKILYTGAEDLVVSQNKGTSI